MDKNISQKALKTIRDKKIKPKSKLEFSIKEYLFWLVFVLSVFIGSFAVSIIIFMVNRGGLGRQSALLNVPYFWIIVLLIFLFLAYFNFKHTKKGYRYNPYLVVVTSVLISIVFGFVIYGFDQAERTDRMLYQKVPIYRKMIHYESNIMPMNEQIKPLFERKKIK